MKHFSFWTLHKAGKMMYSEIAFDLRVFYPCFCTILINKLAGLATKLYIIQHYLNAVKELILCIFLISLFSSKELYWTTFRLDRIAGGPLRYIHLHFWTTSLGSQVHYEKKVNSEILSLYCWSWIWRI